MKEIINIDFGVAARAMKASEVFSDELIISDLRRKKEERLRLENMPTIRLDAITFFICTHGDISFLVDYKNYHLHEGMLLQLSNLHILSNVCMGSHFDGYMVAISPKLAQSIMNDVHTMKQSSIRLKHGLPLMTLSDTEMSYLIDLIVRITKIMKATTHAFQNYILKNEVSNFLLEMTNLNFKRNENGETTNETVGHKEEVAQNFIRLVFNKCKEEHEVSYYAKRMCMTSGNLSRIMKTISGKTAITWINDTLIMESKILLQRSSVNIQQISEELHFGDQSSFGKFFKRHTGETPMEYKNKIHKK